MSDSSTQSSPHTHTTANKNNQTVPQIPIEIVSEEEMALIEAALAAARSSLSSSSSPAISAVSSSSSSLFSSLSSTQFQRNARSIQSITLLSKRRFSGCTTSSVGDIEDLGAGFRSPQKRNRVTESLLHRFRRKRGLSVTDITATEWCEKQMEFFLLLGRPEITKAMKAGRARHAILEEEIVKRVKVRVESDEDVWALKFMNFIVGANQLLIDGLTRELPLIGFTEGVWLVGVVDEVRMPGTETERNPTLVETKTRSQATSPAEPQQRNGRLQLMCYKYMWDNLAADNFPSRQFFDFFSLDPHYILSEEIRENTTNSGFPAKTLDDLVRYFRNTCCMLPPAHDQLLLRYELQEDHSLLGEDQFDYDYDWLKGQIGCSLELWLGQREAYYTPKEERWKCRFCQFASVCPINTNPDGTLS
uniref:Exonuclease V n=2 Tax=Davidia involucrata TaxID=16924 RepID=A0A5B7AUI1_DAVIN